jgi:accessory colonization factor AcfC
MMRSRNADLIFSGSEEMMSDCQIALQGSIDPATIVPLYLRKAAILVRPGNPSHIKGLEDLMKPGHRILVVNGAGQKGLWEDVVGRRGDIASVTKFRANIATVALNSGDARTDWVEDKSLDAWLIWNIWQVSNPSLAAIVPVDEAHQIYRDCGIGLTTQGRSRSEAREFIRFLQSPEGTRIFKKWGMERTPIVGAAFQAAWQPDSANWWDDDNDNLAPGLLANGSGQILRGKPI